MSWCAHDPLPNHRRIRTSLNLFTGNDPTHGQRGPGVLGSVEGVGEEMSKYDILKEMINDWLDREKKNFQDARKSAGINSPGSAMALGAMEAYQQVLDDISKLENEVVIS